MYAHHIVRAFCVHVRKEEHTQIVKKCPQNAQNWYKMILKGRRKFQYFLVFVDQALDTYLIVAVTMNLTGHNINTAVYHS